MSVATHRADRDRLRGLAALAVSALGLVSVAWTAPGCNDPSPPPLSPVVAVDSDEARKALAEDKANREALKRKEAKAARKRKIDIPAEPE